MSRVFSTQRHPHDTLHLELQFSRVAETWSFPSCPILYNFLRLVSFSFVAFPRSPFELGSLSERSELGIETETGGKKGSSRLAPTEISFIAPTCPHQCLPPFGQPRDRCHVLTAQTDTRSASIFFFFLFFFFLRSPLGYLGPTWNERHPTSNILEFGVLCYYILPINIQGSLSTDTRTLATACDSYGIDTTHRKSTVRDLPSYASFLRAV